MSATASTRSTQRDEPHFLAADDGVTITLTRVRGAAEPTKTPVLLVHGVGMRAESFRPPAIRSIVDALIDDGWDVWLLNWRGSIDLDPRPWTLDHVALYDLPAAVRHIVAQTGAESVKVVAHCAGAASVSMAVVAGLLPEVDTVVANGVSLHPVMPPFARTKLHVLRSMMQNRQPYVDIAWGDGPERGMRRLTRMAVRAWHTECTNASCNMASFAIGSGRPALWLHENLDDATHEWISGEFGKIPMSFYAQLAASDRAGQLVSILPRKGLPERYAATAPQSDARFTLLVGGKSRAFLPAGQRATYGFLDTHQPGRHSVRVLPDYGYADVFLGTRAHAEVFPLIVGELNR